MHSQKASTFSEALAALEGEAKKGTKSPIITAGCLPLKRIKEVPEV